MSFGIENKYELKTYSVEIVNRFIRRFISRVKERIGLKGLCHAFAITLIGIVIAYFVVYDFTSFSYFDVTTKSDKDNPFDFFSSVADNSPVGNSSDNVVICDIGSASRKEIIEALEIIDSAEPAAIGLDIIFTQYGCQLDTMLSETISSIRNLVRPISLSYSEDSDEVDLTRSYFDEVIDPDKAYGVVNLDASSHMDIVRKFKTVFEVDDTAALPSFATAIANLAHPDSFTIDDFSEEETIYFPSIDFLTLNIDELEEYKTDLKGKCVLVGRVSDYSDVHRTPIGNEVSGTVIHAIILEQLLSGKRMIEIPNWVNYSVAFVLAYLFVLSAIYYKDSPSSGLVTRLLQFALIIGIAFLGSEIFIKYNMNVDFVPALSLVAFSLVAFDLYYGSIYTLSQAKQFVLRVKRFILNRRTKPNRN